MLIDATHAEETRVVVLDGSRLEDFDVETSTKRQLKGNIYLAKVVRVEPSLQAAFVEYGGNRHGFLAFSEIHPDYYQIPVADRQRLIDAQAEEARLEAEAEDREAEVAAAAPTPVDEPWAEEPSAELVPWPAAGEPDLAGEEPDPSPAAQPAEIEAGVVAAPADMLDPVTLPEAPPEAEVEAPSEAETLPDAEPQTAGDMRDEPDAVFEPLAHGDGADDVAAEPDVVPEQPPPETVGGEDAGEDRGERRIPPRYLRNYKIQEVIKRRQILLVQVVKEERGTKGAALTTYLSLAGRFSVLMPNSPRGGGISRKITSPADRRRLKEIMAELDIPHGMGIIVRTAGANRPKAEIKRDCEYLLRLWDDIREHTLKSVAPALIYEEASLIKRAIRDVYSRDIDEILVDGEPGWRAAHEFMRMLMPTHAKKVQLWKDGGLPLFAKYQVEAQLDSMLMPTVQLRSGGYLVINQTEALVAIDVNSGRSTRERGIEETALRTNLEAAEELARQLRLRDLAGLIVIDFIDMEQRKHNAMVEKRLKEALKSDRARIQVGHISHFGLMEMSRQRLRPSLAETSFVICQHCGGTGHVRSTESAAIHVLRAIEEEGAKRRAAEVIVYAAPLVALYLLNHKRERLADVEERYGMRVLCFGDEAQMVSQYRIERVKAQVPVEVPVAVTQDIAPPLAEPDEAEDEEAIAADEDDEEVAEAETDQSSDEAEHRRRRRRRRRTRREEATADVAVTADEAATDVVEVHVEGVPESADAGEEEHRGRRRGRRGGRRRRPDAGGPIPAVAEPGAEQPDLPPVYAGPTPADPFGGQAFDIFEVMERAETAQAAPAPAPAPAMREESVPEALPPAAPEPVMLDEPEPAQEAATGGDLGSDLDIPPPPSSRPDPILTEPEPIIVEPEHAVPEPLVAAAEPAIKPIIIGGEQDVIAEKKRGWWRR
jgi:ribonuclease E